MPVADVIRETMTRASWIRKMFERGAEMRKTHGPENVFDFTLGNPVLEPPPEFFEALATLSQRRDDGLHRYMPNGGFAHVREAIAAKLAREGLFPGLRGPGVIMSVGAGGGLNATLKAILNPGEEVVMLAPFFAEYSFYIRNHGGEPRVAETTPDFDIDVDALDKVFSPKTRALLVNSPNNPTGRIYPVASLEALGRFLADKEKAYGHPIYLLADEPYREIAYVDGPVRSPAEFHANAFLIYSWSKSLSIPGDRIGYVAVSPTADDPAGLADGLTFTTRTLGFVNAPATMQWIAAELLSVTVDLGWYRTRRDRVVDGLRSAGIEVQPTPEGTFYVFAKSPDADDMAFIDRAMEHRVLLVPGTGFGRKGYFRLSYSVDDRTIDGGLEALHRLMQS